MKPKKTDKWIPAEGSWTFKDTKVAQKFDKHVREQLPWYDLVTKAVVHIAAHYVPKGGVCYDIGASTGNIGRAIAPVLKMRGATLKGIEESPEMAALYQAPGILYVQDAMAFNYEQFDFATIFLCLMFFRVKDRVEFLTKLVDKLQPGGCVVVVDKVNTPKGYAGTCLRRMAMKWKMDNGANETEIVSKELSLAGYQRPLDPKLMEGFGGVEWFHFGEFAGWIIEKPEC